MRLPVPAHTEGLRLSMGSLSFISAFLPVPAMLRAVPTESSGVWECRGILPTSRCSSTEKPFLQNRALLFQRRIPGWLQGCAAQLHGTADGTVPGIDIPGICCSWAGTKRRDIIYSSGGKHRRGAETAQRSSLTLRLSRNWSCIRRNGEQAANWPC